MRRGWLFAAGLVAAVAVAPGARSDVGEPEVAQPVASGVGQVGADGRSLQIDYAVSTNCAVPGALTSVIEAATTVTIGVREETFPYESCPSPGYPVRLVSVALATPLAGRRIVGPLDGLPIPAVPVVPPVFVVRRGRREVRAVPRLIGLAPKDALQAAAIAGARTHFCAVGPFTGLPRAVSQRPAPRAVLGRGDVLRIRFAGGGVRTARCR